MQINPQPHWGKQVENPAMLYDGRRSGAIDQVIPICIFLYCGCLLLSRIFSAAEVPSTFSGIKN